MKRHLLFVLALCTSLLAIPSVYVDIENGDDNSSGADGSNAVATIAKAVSLVDEAGTIHLAAGTYSIPVISSSKSLTLKGSSTEGTVLTPENTASANNGLLYISGSLDALTFSFENLTIKEYLDKVFIASSGPDYRLYFRSVTMENITPYNDTLFRGSLTDLSIESSSLLRKVDLSWTTVSNTFSLSNSEMDSSQLELNVNTSNLINVVIGDSKVQNSSLNIQAENCSLLNSEFIDNSEFRMSTRTLVSGLNTLFKRNAKEVHSGLPFALLGAGGGGKVAFERCDFIENNFDGVAYGDSARFTNCLFVNKENGQAGTFLGNCKSTILMENCTYVGNDTDLSFQSSVHVKNSIISGGAQEGINGDVLQVEYSSIPSGLKPIVAFENSAYYDLPACFVDSAADDYRLSSYSPCIDRGDGFVTSSYGGDKNIKNLGRYGNSEEGAGAVFSSDALLTFTLSGSKKAALSEVYFDTLTVTNSGNDPLYIDSSVNFYTASEGISIKSSAIPYGELVSSEPFEIVVACTSRVAGDIEFRLAHTAKDHTPKIDDTATISVQYDDSESFQNILRPGDWTIPAVDLGNTIIDTHYVTNNGFNTITVNSVYASTPVDSIFFAGMVKSTEIAPGDSAALIAFINKKVEGDFSSTITIETPQSRVGEVTNITIEGGVFEFLDPIVEFETIEPKSQPWDTAAEFKIFVDGRDQDELGEGTGIWYYLWVIDGVEYPKQTDHLFTITSAELGIGKHEIAVYAVDNDGDTSEPAIDSVEVLGVAPVAAIDSVNSPSVVLRDGGDLQLYLSANDIDTENNDSATDNGIDTVIWHSTISGELGSTTTGMLGTVEPSVLPLGLHGFYAMVIDNDAPADTGYSDTIYIPVQNSMGRAVIVTGTPFGETNYFFNNIAPNANIAYKRLEDRGYSREQIFYMNHVGWQSIDGDPMESSNIVDTTVMTKEVLHNHLKAIAGDIQKDIPLVIYLLGHGNANEQNAKFYLDDKDTAQYITPALLNEWLNEFGDLSTNKSHITVILDFCYSGGFINGLKSVTQNRVVVTAASAGATAYFAHGKSFATTIFNETYRGRSLKACFDAAKLWSDRVAPGAAKANPLIDANGDGITNSDADYAIADEIYLGGAQKLQGLIAEIDSISGTYDEATTTTTVTASVSGEIKSMMARIVKLGDGLGSVDMSNATTFEMSAGENNTWSGTYESLDADGKYLILVEGFDEGNNVLLTQGYEVEIGSVSLSLSKTPQKLFFHNSMMGGQTHLNFGLPRTTNVAIDIYDLRGRVIQQIRHEGMNAGVYSLPVNGMASGFYITRFVAGQQQITQKMLIQR